MKLSFPRPAAFLAAFLFLLSSLFFSPLHAAAAKKAKKPAPKAPPPSAVLSEAADEIEFAHQLDSGDAMRLAVLIERFNQQNGAQKDAMRIKLVRAESQGRPAPLNLATPGTVANFLVNKASFRPLHQVLKENKVPLSSDFSANLLFGQSGNRLNALPLAFSTPVLFYNKRLFRQAGLDPEAPPKTWQEMQRVADKLMDNGVSCPYTSSWPAWVHIDNLSAISGEPLANAKGNLAFNGLIQVKHIAMLASWHKAQFFHNFGRANEADSHFYSGECAMITTNVQANRYFADAPGVESGVAPLPYHEELRGGPRHTLASGASLWIGAGYKKKTYQNIARFAQFLLAPDLQIEIARAGGFLPLTETARKAIKSQILKDEEQALEVAYASLKEQGAREPLRVSVLDPVRIVLDEELEQVWAGRQPAKAALDTAVSRGNAILAARPALRKALK
ncbi:MAG: extracellular solute-binding protein [Zoogloeaceae bacterium]|jgi:sn-glycerol 3-phosphate transport system substrate-binding protein|nr:extracellular solute-binding protein [Zoogloeaceae bacterium]